MSISELKLEIINRLSSIEDKMILQEIYNLIKEGSDQDAFYTLSSEEKKAIEAGLNDIQNGDVYSSEKANDLIREWLKK
jgi:predicted transcriptional regulator